MVVRLVQFAEIVIVWRCLVCIRACARPAAQHVSWGLQIHDDVRRHHVLGEKVENFLINEEFVIVEVQVGVNLVFVEEIVGNRQLRKKVGLS